MPALFTSGVKNLYCASTFIFVPKVDGRTGWPWVACHIHSPTAPPKLAVGCLRAFPFHPPPPRILAWILCKMKWRVLTGLSGGRSRGCPTQRGGGG